MKSIYFYFRSYPNWVTGGEKYHFKIYYYLKTNFDNINIIGNSRIEGYLKKSKLLRSIAAMVHYITIPKKSTLILSNSLFLVYYLPCLINRFQKRINLLVIVHHLVQRDRPTYLRKIIEYQFLRNATTLIANSYTTKKELLRIGINVKNIPVIYPGVDCIPSTYKSKEYDANPRILFIGSIEPRKGVITLLESLKYISKINYVVDIVGNYDAENSYYKKCLDILKKLKLQSKVNFHGKVDNQTLSRYYTNATIFAFPSYWEGFGIVIAEAMSYGVPIICSNIETFEELIDDNVTGILFNTGDSHDLGIKLKRILKNKEQLSLISRNALARSRNFSGWEKVSNQLLDIINQKYEF